MTHFGVLVLLPGDTDINDSDAVETAISERLAAYDENTEVPEYDRPCYCIGRAAQHRAEARANEVAGSIDTLRSMHAEAAERLGYTFPKQPIEPATEDQKEAYWIAVDAHNARLQALWTEMIKPWDATRQAYFETDPLNAAPDPACSSCQGLGSYKSTYNPKSRWDWWTINGRFAGWDDGDQYIIKVTDLPPDWDVWAIVTEDGTWHESGQMGYWAMSTDNKEPRDWDAERFEIVSGHTNCWACLIDAHI